MQSGGPRIELLDDVASIEQDWERLANNTGSIFHTVEWNQLWCTHFGEGRRLRILIGRESDGSVAWITPLVRERIGPFRILGLVGQGVSDEIGPIAPSGLLGDASAALRGYLDSTRDWDVLVLRHLAGNREWATDLGGEVLRRESSPSLALTGLSWDDYLATRGSNFRQRVRRRERVLHRDHDTEFRMTDDPARLDADLDTLFRLHDMRWGEETEFSGRRRAFHRDFARAALANGWLRLWILELDGVPAAATYGFRFGGADWLYQSGRDAQFDQLRVGRLLIAHTIRSACEDGIDSYHLLRGGETYKSEFADHDHGLQTVVRGRGLRNRAAVASLRFALPRYPKLVARWS